MRRDWAALERERRDLRSGLEEIRRRAPHFMSGLTWCGHSTVAVPKTFLFKDAAVSGFGSLQDGGSITSATTTTGWTVAKDSPTQSFGMSYGSELAATVWGGTDTAPTATAPAATFTGGWRTENALTGTFASGDWTVSIQCCGVSSTGTQDGRFALRVFRGPNADGSSAVEMTTARNFSSTATNLGASPGSTLTATVSVTANRTLSAEYVFLKTAWQITGAGGNNNCDVLFRVGTSASFITTTAFG